MKTYKVVNWLLLIALLAVSALYAGLRAETSKSSLLARVHAMESKYAVAESYCEAHAQCRRSR